MGVKRPAIAIVLGLGCAAVLLWAMPTDAAGAAGVWRFVSPTGRDAIPVGNLFLINNCLASADPCRTVQHAVNQAAAGDTVVVAGGVYTSTGTAVVMLGKSVALVAGWDGVSGVPPVCDPRLHPVVLDGERARRGVHITTGVAPTVTGFIIARGWASGTASNGGGVYVAGGAPLLAANIITDNVAKYYGGGVYVAEGKVVISGNQVLSNLATYGGGGVHLGYRAVAWLHGNRIVSNRASYGSGIEGDHAIITATANLIVRNRDGGAFMVSGSEGRLWGVNNVLAFGESDALVIWQVQATLLHSTIVSNAGTAVMGDYGAALTLMNNIVAFNQNGVMTGTGAQVAGSRNLWWRNGGNAFTGTQALVADPRLAADGYHLGLGSPAVDVALDLGIVRDVDGDRRPIGQGYDIGADERRLTVVLPLALRSQG